MKKSFGGIAAMIVVAGMGVASQITPASAMQISASPVAASSNIVDVKMRGRKPVCRMETVRKHTPRGWVVSHVRRCR